MKINKACWVWLWGQQLPPILGPRFDSAPFRALHTPMAPHHLPHKTKWFPGFCLVPLSCPASSYLFFKTPVAMSHSPCSLPQALAPLWNTPVLVGSLFAPAPFPWGWELQCLALCPPQPERAQLGAGLRQRFLMYKTEQLILAVWMSRVSNVRPKNALLSPPSHQLQRGRPLAAPPPPGVFFPNLG